MVCPKKIKLRNARITVNWRNFVGNKKTNHILIYIIGTNVACLVGVKLLPM